MKTEADVLGILFNYFNVSAINSLLDGEIYLKKRLDIACYMWYIIYTIKKSLKSRPFNLFNSNI